LSAQPNACLVDGLAVLQHERDGAGDLLLIDLLLQEPIDRASAVPVTSVCAERTTVAATAVRTHVSLSTGASIAAEEEGGGRRGRTVSGRRAALRSNTRGRSPPCCRSESDKLSGNRPPSSTLSAIH
jgi:hypothetical protein